MFITNTFIQRFIFRFKYIYILMNEENTTQNCFRKIRYADYIKQFAVPKDMGLLKLALFYSCTPLLKQISRKKGAIFLK